MRIDKVGSVLKNLQLPTDVTISPMIQGKEGEVLIVQALSEEKVYGTLELTNGRLAKIYPGDIIAGILGQRKALESIVGIIPSTVAIGDTLHILNMGGVLGKAISWNKEFVVKPIPVKVLGSLTINNKPVTIHDFTHKKQHSLTNLPPIIAVIGSSMGAGKTTAASEIIHTMAKKMNLHVVAGKVTGVATQRDILGMQDAGAKKTLSFLDIGLPSTINHKNLVIAGTKQIITILSESHPDCIVLEFGDGLIGWYGVEDLLADIELAKTLSFVVACANDLTGAYGMLAILKHNNISVDFFSGRVANTAAGIDYIETFLHTPADDLREKKEKFVQVFTQKGLL